MGRVPIPKIQSVREHGKSHVPQHNWDDIEKGNVQVPGQLISLFINKTTEQSQYLFSTSFIVQTYMCVCVCVAKSL